MKTHVVLFLALSLSPAAALAQNVALSIATTSDLVASIGTNQQTVSLPVGPIAATGQQSAWVGVGTGDQAGASLGWSYDQFGNSFAVTLAVSAAIQGAAPGQAISGPHDLIVSITAPTAMPISLRLERTLSGTPGSPLPLTRVDVYDDGWFELDDWTPAVVDVSVVAGPTPVAVRCQIGAEFVGVGYASSLLRVFATPGHGVVNSILPGCTATNYFVAPRFDGNFDYGTGLFTGIAAAVFGTDTQPIFLGNLPAGPFTPALPCVLMPRPDFIVPLTALATQTLVVPPAARPFVIYSQSVQLDGAALTTSEAFQVYGL